MLNINNRQALLGFSYFAKIGSINISRLEKIFCGAKNAFLADIRDLEKTGLKNNLINDFIVWRQNFNIIKAEKELEREQIYFITWHDKNYPILLKNIHDAPYILYYKGSLKILNDQEKNRLAIVGSRKHSAYAEKIINEFLPLLIEAGLEIISGLALGVDSLAHEATLKNKGKTIAVLGSGLSQANIYPSSNRFLAKKIITNSGLIISEFPPHIRPFKQNFPQRNRIISGLSQAVLIIEAKEKSGALITAYHALDQNREVMAIPGNVFSEFSHGPNKLIKMGGKTITKPEEILESFKIQPLKNVSDNKNIIKKVMLENEIEKIIYQVLRRAHEQAEKITVDEIVKITKLDTSVINSTLSILELRGIAKSDGIGYDIN